MFARITFIVLVLISLALYMLTPHGLNIDLMAKDPVENLKPPSFLVNEYIIKYSKEYGIPEDFMRKCAKLETGYKGFMHEAYNPFTKEMISSAQAYGVMQIRLCAARQVWPMLKKISDDSLSKKLRFDINFNMLTSVRYISYLRNVFKVSWVQAFSMYNQGYIGKENINGYARYIVNN